MHTRWIAWGILLCWSCLLVGDESAQEIMKAQMDRHGLDQEREELTLRIVKKNGATKEREMLRFAQQKDDGSVNMMAILTGPEEVKGTGILFQREAAAETCRQWLYLPALHMAKKISSSGKKNNFMGTDFSYEDMQPVDLAVYDLHLIEREMLDGKECYVIDVVPATAEEQKASGYSKRRVWIRTDILFTVKTDFYDNKGQVTKVWVNEDLVQVSEKVWRTDRMIMTSSKKGRRTELIVRNRDTGTPFEEGFFNIDRVKTWFDD